MHHIGHEISAHAVARRSVHARQRQVDILGTGFEPDEFLAQLESEHRVKPEVRARRDIGFL